MDDAPPPRLGSALRGRFKQVVDAGTGAAPQAELRGVVLSAPGAGPRQFLTLRVERPPALVEAVDAFVRARVPALGFSPLLRRGDEECTLVVKVPPGALATVAGLPAALARGDGVRVTARPGVFGAFGYTWLARRVQPDPEK